jgi:MFS family permease
MGAGRGRVATVMGRYRAVFRAPGSARFCAAAFVMRMPIAIYPIGLVLLLSIRTGEYSSAGLLSGCYIIGGAIGMPLTGRLIDRVGQERVIRRSAAVHVLAAVGLVVAAEASSQPVWLFAPVFVMGLSYVSVGSLVRARWSFALSGTPDLSTAYSLESVLDEVIFVVGPIVASVLAIQVDPIWVVVLGAVLVAGGGWWLASLRSTEPPAGAVEDTPRRSALAHPGMPLLMMAMVGMGGIFGSVEVVLAAFAGQHDERSRTGLVLATFALASGVAGLVYGARHWATPLLRRYWLHSVIFAALVPLFLSAGSMAQLYPIAFVAGLGISPTLITGFAMVEELVPPRGLTEGLAWTTTGLNVGYGALAAVVGGIADRHGAHVAFFVPVASGVVVAVATSLLVLRLRRVHRPVVVPR